METKETIIFEVDVTSYEKSLALLSNSINALKADQKAYLEDSKKGIAGAAEAYEKVTVQLKNQQQAYRTTQAASQGYVAGQKSGVDVTNLANNSIQQNRDLLKQLTAQYINTNNPSEAFTKKIKSISDALKQQESVIGDTRRNVGNYAEGFVQAFREIGGVNIGSVIDPLKNMKAGFDSAGGGVAGFQAALLGAVPLVIAGVEGMTSIVMKFDDVVEGLEDTFAGASMAFDYFVSQGNQGSFTDMLTNLNAAYEAGVQLSGELRYLGELTDLQRVNNARNGKEVDKLILQSKDRTKTEKERLALLDEASAKEKKNLDENLSLADKRQKIAQQELRRVIEQGLNNDKQLKERNDAEVAFLELERQSQNLQEKIVNRRNQLIEQEQANREKENAQKKKDAEEQEKRDEKAAKDYSDLQQFKLNELKKADEQRKQIEQKAEADRLAALSKNFQIENDFLQRQLQLDLTAIDLSVATEEEKARRKEEIQINSLERQLDLAIQFLGADGDITKTELQGIETIKQAIEKVKQGVSKPTKNDTTLGSALGISKDDISEIQNGLKQVGDVVSGIGNLVNTVYDGRIQDVENEKNAEIQAIEDSTASREEKDKRIKELNRKTAMETYEIQKQQFEVNKAISIVQTLINTAAAVVAQLANPTPYAGIALAALAAATGVAQVAVIASQQPPAPPKFAKGVIGLEGGGTETSDSIPALLSKNESVITAKATKKYHRELAWMEQSVGNTPNYNFSGGRFAGGVIGNAGFDTRQVSTSALQRAEMTLAIKEAMLSAPAPVVSVKEFNRVNSGVQRSVRVSEV